jgi:dTDP-4-amino-4,6-dideoxygalactose transaminase
MRAMGIGAGDAVMVPANSFIATSEAVTNAGATPIFVDCDPATYNISTSHLLEVYDKYKNKFNIRAVIPVHLYGAPADMDGINAIAKDKNLLVIEDAAQAHGALYKGKTVGSLADAASFSFYPGKNLGAYGDAGAVVTSNRDLAVKVRMIANHGRVEKYNHEIEGMNSRLDGLQAAILNVKLKHIAGWTARRQEVAKQYIELLTGTSGIALPIFPKDASPVFHLFVVRVKKRAKVLEYLKVNGIDCGVHYPIALPNLKAYAHHGYALDDYPVATRYQNEIMSLPIFPELSEAQVKYVTKILKEAVTN